jgi:hypothetical protein
MKITLSGVLHAYGGVIVLILALAFLGLFAEPEVASARDNDPYVPQVIEVPQDHAWCYVLVNTQRGIGNIHILSCVPK